MMPITRWQIYCTSADALVHLFTYCYWMAVSITKCFDVTNGSLFKDAFICFVYFVCYFNLRGECYIYIFTVARLELE